MNPIHLRIGSELVRLSRITSKSIILKNLKEKWTEATVLTSQEETTSLKCAANIQQEKYEWMLAKT